MTNAPALFRSLLVYGLCLPLAVFLGYLLATPMDNTSIVAVEIVFFVLAIPLLLRWHHPWLIATWNSSLLLFFLPGKPPAWMGLAAVSFAISLLQYTLNRKMRFLHAPTVMWPLLLLTAVILVTARFSGGLGVRILGGDVYGGKKYFFILAAVVGYFAIINRRIPPERAGLYVALFFLGAATLAIGDLPAVLPRFMQFLVCVLSCEQPGRFHGSEQRYRSNELISRRSVCRRWVPRSIVCHAGPLWHPWRPGFG